MAKFSGASFISEIIECGIFFLIMHFFGSALGNAAEFVGSLFGKTIATIVNFAINKKLVFKAKGGMKKQLARFFAFSALQLLCSVVLIMLISDLLGIESAFAASLVKYGVDLLLFFAGYNVQKRWVFKKTAVAVAPQDESEPNEENQ